MNDMKRYALVIAVALFLFSGAGCYKKEAVPSADFSISRNDSIVPDTVTFHNLSTNAESYKWDFGDNTTSSATNPVHIYTDTVTATYSIMLKAYSKSGEQWAIKTRSLFVLHKK
ncbi:MAG: PKD domain-containing protein [Bacteroidales bacterium]|jgi:PKD repeat protein